MNDAGHYHNPILHRLVHLEIKIMSLSVPIALIFGAGKNVGAGVARAFTAKGYRIATVSRTASTDSDNDKQMHIRGDMADPESISGIFDTVRKYWGHPSVVVINGASIHNYMVF